MAELESPESLTEEHRALLRGLRELAKEEGEMGRAVEKLLAALQPHFEKEEKNAMPLLGALKPLSEGMQVPDHQKVDLLHRRFASDYPVMLKEHAQVKRLVGEVRTTAARVGDKHALVLMSELEHHATVEEEVLYPAAMLVGLLLEGGAFR